MTRDVQAVWHGVGDSHGAISGNRAIELPNIPAIAGGCVAGIGLLSVHCLIAAQFAQRADLEIRAYFILWLACLVDAAVRPPARACREQAATLALLCLGLQYPPPAPGAVGQRSPVGCRAGLGLLTRVVERRRWRHFV